MKTKVRIWSYLAHFFLEWEVFRAKVADRIKTNILCPITCFNLTAYELMEGNFEPWKVGIFHQDIARPQVAGRGVASNVEGSWENNE